MPDGRSTKHETEGQLNEKRNIKESQKKEKRTEERTTVVRKKENRNTMISYSSYNTACVI